MTKKAAKRYRIFGCTINKNTGKGIEGLLVEAWDKDLICDDLVGRTLTDEQGNFQMEFDDSYFKDLFIDQDPDLFFRVFRKKKLLASTENEVIWNFKSQKKKIVIAIEEVQPELPVYPDPHQYPDVRPDNPVNLGDRVFPPEPGEWKENIQKYWLKLQDEKDQDAPRRPRLRSFMECSGNLIPQLPQLVADEPGTISFTVRNKGNFPGWSCYVELYRGRSPVGTGTPLTEYELQGRQIITLQPGENREVTLPFVRFTGLITAVGICYDPVLDPKDFTLVEVHRQITAGTVNIFDVP